MAGTVARADLHRAAKWSNILGLTNFGISMGGVVELKTKNNNALRHQQCRLCNAPLTTTFVDLGMSPLCESILAADQIDQMEPFFPLHVLVCNNCFLVQLREYVKPESIFTEYDYFSSYSTSWVEHARQYCEMIIARLNLGQNSQVYEIASNDGYLLQHFVRTGHPCDRHRAGRQCCGGRSREEYSDNCGIFRRGTCATPYFRRKTRRPHHRQQCTCAGARPQ